MRGEMTPRDLRVQQQNSNGRTIHQDLSRQNQAIEYDRGPLDARRSYRGKPAFATEAVRPDARHSHRITPAFANDGDWPTELTSRQNRRAETRRRRQEYAWHSYRQRTQRRQRSAAIAESQPSQPRAYGRTHSTNAGNAGNAEHHGTAFAEAIPTSKGAIRTSKGEIGYWRWGSSDMTLPTSTVMELKGCQRE